MTASEPAPRRTMHAVRPEETTRVPMGEPGLVLGGKYRLERRIASGGSASVWKATHITLNRPVAVKFVDSRVTAHGGDPVERFLREAKVAASIRHKNVVDIVDFGVFDSGGVSEPYMIMELLEGEALDDLLHRGVPRLEDTCSIVRQILSGLEAVHAAGIVHRDMKPGNVFITEDGDGYFARVLDFGISLEGIVDGDRTVVGTPEYMSPEQAYGDPTDRRTDIYAVGVMLYEMLAGFLPYDDPDPSRVLAMVVAGKHRKLADVRTDVPALAAIAERAMSSSPDDRYASAREMQKAIAEATGVVDVTGRFSIAPRRSSGLYRREQPTMDATDHANLDREHLPTRPSSDLRAPSRPSMAPARGLGVRDLGWPFVAALVIVLALAGWAVFRLSTGPSAIAERAPDASADAREPVRAAPPSVVPSASSVVPPAPSTVDAPAPSAPSTLVAEQPAERGAIDAPAEAEPPATHASSGARRHRPPRTTTAPAPGAPGTITRELDF